MALNYLTKCPICGGKITFIKSETINFISPSGYAYYCEKCHAAVGTHKSQPKKPLGTIADNKTKDMRVKCHKVFDNLWSTKSERDNLYHQLSQLMNIPYSKCHFGLMNYAQLLTVYEILKQWWRKKFDK